MDIDRTSTHYKGVFANIYEVNKKYPNGGTDGDYVEMDGWAHYWNADRGTWCVNSDRDSYWDEKLSALKGTKQIAEMDKAVHEVQQQAEASKAQIQALVNALPVVQQTGDSPTSVMSQKAVTDAINAHKIDETHINHHVVSNNETLNLYVHSLYIPDLTEANLATYKYVRIIDRHFIDSNSSVWPTAKLIKVTKVLLTSGTLVSDTSTTLYYKTSELTTELTTSDSTTYIDSNSNSYTDKTKIFRANSKYYLVDGLTSYTVDSLYIDSDGTEYVDKVVTAANVNGTASTETYYTGNTSSLSATTQYNYETGIELGKSNTSFDKSYVYSQVSFNARTAVPQEGMIKTINGAYIEFCWSNIKAAEDSDGYIVIGATLDNCVLHESSFRLLNELIEDIQIKDFEDYSIKRDLFDFNELGWTKTEGFLKNGEVQSSTSIVSYITDYIATNAGDEWGLFLTLVSAFDSIHTYDAEQKFLKSYKCGSGTTSFAVPQGVSYIKFCNINSIGIVRKQLLERKYAYIWKNAYQNRKVTYFELANSMPVNKNGLLYNQTQNNQTSRYTNYLAVKPGSMISIQSNSVGSCLSYILYDIKGMPLTSYNAKGNVIMEIPQNVYYIVCGSLGSLSVNFYDDSLYKDVDREINVLYNINGGITYKKETQGFWEFNKNKPILNTSNIKGIRTNYICCKEGWEFVLSTDATGSCLSYCFLDKFYTPITYAIGKKYSLEKLTAPKYAAYAIFFGLGSLSVTCDKFVTSNATLEYLIKENPLWGKTLVVVGDSITAEMSTDPDEYPWPHRIAERNSMGFTNCAVSGSNIAGTYSNLISSLTKDTDYFVMMEGHNDNGRVDLGTIDDEYAKNGTKTFYGYLNAVLRHCLTVNPAMKILIITPTFDWSEDKRYTNAVINIAKKWGTGLMDLYNDYHINMTIQRERNTDIGLSDEAKSLRIGTLLKDGIHPNALGHEMFSRTVEGYMRLLL